MSICRYGQSSSNCQQQVLRGVGQRLGVDLNVDTAVNIIIREKSIKPVLQQQLVIVHAVKFTSTAIPTGLYSTSLHVLCK